MTFNKIIIIPTDTVYGIGTGIDNFEGLKKIYEIKKRPFDKQIPILFSNFNHLKEVIDISPKLVELGSMYWPGALTIICNTTEDYQNQTKEKTLAIRMPANIELLELLEQVGPLRVTSLNNSGEKPLELIDEIKDKYQLIVDQIYEFNNSNLSNVSSTIVDITKDDINIIRQGELIIK